jgi:hypothetical protein
MPDFTREEVLATVQTLIEADLQGIDFHQANLSQANLRGANLSGADLRFADMRGANLRRANLHRADLRGATLINAQLSMADMRVAALRGTDMRGANLQGTNMYPGSLRYTHLRGATYDKRTQFPEGFDPDKHELVLGVSLQHVLEMAQKNGRICPMPGHWHLFHKELMNNGTNCVGPLILGVWNTTARTQKKEVLETQIRHAYEDGVLDIAYDFLTRLRTEDWYLGY